MPLHPIAFGQIYRAAFQIPLQRLHAPPFEALWSQNAAKKPAKQANQAVYDTVGRREPELNDLTSAANLIRIPIKQDTYQKVQADEPDARAPQSTVSMANRLAAPDDTDRQPTEVMDMVGFTGPDRLALLRRTIERFITMQSVPDARDADSYVLGVELFLDQIRDLFLDHTQPVTPNMLPVLPLPTQQRDQSIPSALWLSDFSGLRMGELPAAESQLNRAADLLMQSFQHTLFVMAMRGVAAEMVVEANESVIDATPNPA